MNICEDHDVSDSECASLHCAECDRVLDMDNTRIPDQDTCDGCINASDTALCREHGCWPSECEDDHEEE